MIATFKVTIFPDGYQTVVQYTDKPTWLHWDTFPGWICNPTLSAQGCWKLKGSPPSCLRQ